jgi:ATP-dependent helicase HrpB
VTLEPLPIDAYLPEIRDHLATHRALVISAAPGAGKTTRVPPALVDRGPVILLQPRRVAARAVTRRIVQEQEWTLGREAGWQIRYERRSSSDTRLLVVTEGILTARLQHDPLLSDFTTIVFDEFHERSIHSDIGLALARQAWLARDELHIVVMSATLETERVSNYLGGCPIVEVTGTRHPLRIEYAPDDTVAGAVHAILPRTDGQILCFLPGVREIEATQRELAARLDRRFEIVPLHGSLDGEAQDRALRPGSGRRVIVATNIAETSLTVPGVSAVVDSGLHKVVRHDGARGIDGLHLERISQDAADQRAGRAARLGPGIARRLWDPRQRLQPHREADITRLDVAGPVLYLLAWGANLERFEWFEAPPPSRLADALRLLTRLGAIDSGRLTAMGRQMLRIPVHPRLARILIDGRGAPEVVATCARLSGDAAFEDPLRRVVGEVIAGPLARHLRDDEVRHAIFTGYADRLARRRAESRDRVVMASGHGGVIGREVEPFDHEFLVALDVVAGERSGHAEAYIRAASAVDRDWVVATSSRIEHRMDAASGRVRAFRVERYDSLVLAEHPARTDPDAAAALLAQAWLERGPDESTLRLLRRARFAGRPLDLAALAHEAAFSVDSVDDLDIGRHLAHTLLRTLQTDAPEALPLPSGREARLEYEADGSVSASVKLQELFGLAESPRVGRDGVPVTFHLLAPNGRPVQTTRDLRSFWERTYPEVRKELRGRYPKHPWPDDPWTATPTHRSKAASNAPPPAGTPAKTPRRSAGQPKRRGE